MKWIKKNKKELLIVFLILLVGAFVRLYKIDEYMMFLGDEGRDVTVVRRFLKEGDLMFVGPGTSVGNMYLGPIYYYFMAPWLWLWNYSPVGPAVGVALLGVGTIWFLYYIIRLWTKNPLVAYAVATLYALSPVVIFYSRSSWNPNIMPFFALLLIFSLWKVWEERKWKWLIVGAFAFAVTLQSHYLALLLFPVIFVVWILNFRNLFRVSNLEFRVFLRYSLLATCFLLLLMSPLFLFDYKHNWRNMSAVWDYFTRSDSDIRFRIGIFISHLWLVWEKLNIRLLAGTNVFWGRVLAVLLLGFIVVRRHIQYSKYHILLALWLGFGILGLALYKGDIYDHYIGFLFPAIFILLGVILQNLGNRYLIYIVFGILYITSLINSPLRKYPNRLLERSIMVAEVITKEANGLPYNFALIGDKNYEPNYQYFLEDWETKIVEIDPQRYSETLTDQLFVVCEYPKEQCQPASNPKAQVANFGWSKIEASWDVEGVTVYKLVHNKP